MRVLDLFSGIGGFSLGLERAGMRTVAFCEIEPYCRAVLRKHWPHVPVFNDVRELSAQHLTAAGISVDVICGGFPCQDISIAGKKEGIDGERSGLWSEFSRLISEIQPRYVIVENVAALLGRDLGRILGDLAALGYDAEWHCIRASDVGLPHSRDRTWIVSYPSEERREGAEHGPHESDLARRLKASLSTTRSDALSAEEFDREIRAAEFVRTSNGLPYRAYRIAALGNAVVPQIPEIIGRSIMALEI